VVSRDTDDVVRVDVKFETSLSIQQLEKVHIYSSINTLVLVRGLAGNLLLTLTMPTSTVIAVSTVSFSSTTATWVRSGRYYFIHKELLAVATTTTPSRQWAVLWQWSSRLTPVVKAINSTSDAMIPRLALGSVWAVKHPPTARPLTMHRQAKLDQHLHVFTSYDHVHQNFQLVVRD